MPWCNKCGEHMLYPNTHKCPPKWEVLREDEGDEPVVVFGRDAQDAGERYARQSDNYGDYEFANGSEAEVKIRKAGSNDQWKVFILSAEPDVIYHARLKS